MQQPMSNDRIADVLGKLGLDFEAKDTHYTFVQDGLEKFARLDSDADMLHVWTFYNVAFRDESVAAAVQAANYINVQQLAPKAVVHRSEDNPAVYVRFDNIITVAAGMSDEQLIDFFETASTGDQEATQILNEGLQQA